MSEQRGKTIKFKMPAPGEEFAEVPLGEFLAAMPDDALMATVNIAFSLLAERFDTPVGLLVAEYTNALAEEFKQAMFHESRN